MNPLIECQNLSQFFGAKKALDNVSFSCQAGEPIALVGPNGAGKTTLFSLLCHYFTPSAGSVRILGLEPGDRRLFGQVSALPQDAQLDPSFSLKTQLSFYAQLQGFDRKAAGIETERVLTLMDLANNIHSLPNDLSHGMRKRAAIAQALIGSPQLVLLDEPTAGLDPANAKNIRQQIASLSSETTFVISSHNLQELERLCNTVLYIENGQLQQQTQLNMTDADSYLTIHMNNIDSPQFIQTISQMVGSPVVSSDQKNEFVIRYDGEQHKDFDQQLLKQLASLDWEYRRLIKGKTLEERLFS